MRVGRFVGLALPILLAGCLGGGEERPPPRPVARAPSLPPPAAAATAQCYADLSRQGVRFNPLPDRDFGGGCQVLGSLQLVDIGVPVTGLKSMRCPLARAFVDWLRQVVDPEAQRRFGSKLARVETFGTYACRNVIGNAGYANRLSGHALANAVDVSGFVLADGRRVTIEAGWRSDDEDEREFLQAIHDGACRRFGTVLSPDYNEAHRNHLHLEADSARFCR